VGGLRVLGHEGIHDGGRWVVSDEGVYAIAGASDVVGGVGWCGRRQEVMVFV